MTLSMAFGRMRVNPLVGLLGLLDTLSLPCADNMSCPAARCCAAVRGALLLVHVYIP